jgi:hypothetical protein
MNKRKFSLALDIWLIVSPLALYYTLPDQVLLWCGVQIAAGLTRIFLPSSNQKEERLEGDDVL